MLDLLTAHKILIFFAMLLGFALMAWGIVNGLYRHEPDAIGMFLLGALSWPVALMYFVKLYRHPPIH